ncbi:CSM1 Protein CMS1 [Candida maltosa Xu316]
MSKQQPIADDLDDGLEYDVGLSESEEVDVPETETPLDLDEEEKEQKPEEEVTPVSRKRRNSESNSLKEKKKIKMEMDIESKKNLSLEENPENQNLSALELTELYFNKSEIRSTSDFKETRNLDNLGKFITTKFKNMLPKGSNNKKDNKKKKGNKKNQTNETDNEPKDDQEERKFIAIVSMSAIRACDIHRATKDLSGSSLKIINKNKLSVDLKLVKTTRSRVLCCTPGRLIKVLNNEDSELSKNEIKIVIVDNSYLDTKKQNIWDINETFEGLKALTKEGSKVYLY